MRKRMTGLLLAVLLTGILAVPAYADEIQGGEDWMVNFDGSGLESNFTSKDMNEIVRGLQPGDTVTFTLALKNSSGKGADWWMTNQVLSSFEDASVANGGAYTYILSYKDAAGNVTDIYSSDSVGGEDTSGGVGLHRATIGMEEFFYLDHLADGASGTVTLQVALDGETQGNNYQNTLADLALRFAVEPNAQTPPPEQPQNPQNPETPNDPPEPNQTKTVNTGDETQIMKYVLMAGGSGAVLLLLAVMSLRRNRREQEEGGSMQDEKA